MLRQDSIHTEAIVEPIVNDSATQIPTRPQTPYQVLRLLPKDATPAQQDSAIQAWFQPSEINYSSRPDTLHLPGHGIGRNPLEVNIPQYYQENFFSKDTLYHTGVDGGRFGVAGVPVPKSVRNSDFVSSFLLLSLFVALIIFATIKRFIYLQSKNFFKVHKEELSQTAVEIRGQLILFIITCCLLSILYFFYTIENIAETFILSSDYTLLAIFFGVIVGYFLLKAIIYTGVNLVFFDGKKNKQWLLCLLFLIGVQGALLFPAVLLLTYLDLTSHIATFYVLGVLVLVKILTFYKCFEIFFKQNGLYLQIILYFCALEVVPLITLWSGLGVIADELKINF